MLQEENARKNKNSETIKIPCAFGLLDGCMNEMQHKYINCLIEGGETAHFDLDICRLCMEASKVSIMLMILEELKKKNIKI